MKGDLLPIPQAAVMYVVTEAMAGRDANVIAEMIDWNDNKALWRRWTSHIREPKERKKKP